MERGDFLRRVIVGLAAAQGLDMTPAQVQAIENKCELVDGAGSMGHKALMPDFALKIPFGEEYYLIPIYHSAPSGYQPRG